MYYNVFKADQGVLMCVQTTMLSRFDIRIVFLKFVEVFIAPCITQNGYIKAIMAINIQNMQHILYNKNQRTYIVQSHEHVIHYIYMTITLVITRFSLLDLHYFSVKYL